MPELFLDSSVVIDATNDHHDALKYVNGLLIAQSASLHAVTFAEIIVGTRNAREVFRLQRFLRRFAMEAPTPGDWSVALEFLGRLHLSHNVDLPDCLIAATALRLKYSVATINDRHFRLFEGLRVVRPY